ncbi:hypothetical protein ACFX13_005377 [Malus domestica]
MFDAINDRVERIKSLGRFGLTYFLYKGIKSPYKQSDPREKKLHYNYMVVKCSCNSHQIYMLIQEDQFLAQHRGPVSIRVSVPSANEGNLKGKFLEITVQSLSESVVKLKEKISTEIQLPANKRKLSGKPGFLKDNLSLAYYNVGAGETLTLSVRERGGRKR